jgi:hypothetical protein
VASIQFDSSGRVISDDAAGLTKQVVGSNIARDGKPVTAVRVTDSGLYRTQPGSTSFHQVNDGATIQFAAGNKTVNVGGFEVDPAVAETLKRIAPGGRADDPQPTSEQPSAPQSEQPNAQPEVDPLDVIENPLGAEIVAETRKAGIGHLASMVTASMSGDQNRMQSAIGRYAAAVGIEPDLAAGRFGIVVAELTKQAQKLAAENNVDFAEFNRWAAAHYRDTAAQAILKHLQMGSTRGAWEPLMRQFARRGGGR